MRVNYNGNFIEFPDNMSDDEINNALSELPSDFFVGQQDAPKIADEELRGAVSGIFDYSDNNAADVVHHGAVESQPEQSLLDKASNYASETSNSIKENGLLNTAKQVSKDAWLNTIEGAANYGEKAVDSSDSDVVRGAETAFKQVPQLGYGLEAAAGATAEKYLGEGGIATDIKKQGLEGYIERSKDIQADSKPSDSFTYSLEQAQKGDFNSLVDFVQYGIGYMAGQGVQSVATAGAGSALAKTVFNSTAKDMVESMVAKEVAELAAKDIAVNLTAEEVAKLATSNVAGKIASIGATSAMGLNSLAMEGGEIGGDLAVKADKENRQLTGEEIAKGLGSTFAAAGLDLVGDKAGVDAVLGKLPLGEIGKYTDGLKGKLLRGTSSGLKAGGIESGTEFGQTLIEEYGKGNDPTSKESIKQAVDSAAMGFVGGTGMGTVGGMLSSPEQKPAGEISPETLAQGNEDLANARTEAPTKPDNLGDVNSILKRNLDSLDDIEHQKEVTQTIGDEITSAENIDDAITKSNAVIDLTLQDATIHNAGTKADEDKAQLESEIDKDKQQSILNQQSITDDAIKSASEESKAIADADKVDALIDAGASLIGKFFVLPNGKKVVATKDQLSYAKDKLKQVEKSRSEIAPTELQTGTDETQERRSQNQINDVLTNDTEFNQTESATNNARVTPLSQAVDSELVYDATKQKSVLNENNNNLPIRQASDIDNLGYSNIPNVSDANSYSGNTRLVGVDKNLDELNPVLDELATQTIDTATSTPKTLDETVDIPSVTYDNIEGATAPMSHKTAASKFKTKAFDSNDHVAIPVSDKQSIIAPLESLSFEQYAGLKENTNQSRDAVVSAWEGITGKVAPVETLQKENAPEISTEGVAKDVDGHSDSLQGDSVSNNDDEAYDSILTENKLPNGYSATILSSQPSKYGRGRFATTAEITRPDGSKYNESIDHYDQIPTGVYSGNKNYERDDNGFIKRGSNKPITQGDVSNTPVDTKPNVPLDSTQAPANAAFKIGGYYMDSEGNAIIEKNTSNIVKNGVDSFLDVATDNKFPTLKSAQNYLKKHFNSDEYEAIGYSLKPKTYTIIKKSIDVPVEGKSVFTEGQTFVTATERRTSPYPATGKGDKSHNEWLKKESIEEANARGDSLRARIFEKHGGDGLYLFDKEYSAIVQPKKSILKDIDVSPSNQQPAAQTSSEPEWYSRGMADNSPLNLSQAKQRVDEIFNDKSIEYKSREWRGLIDRVQSDKDREAIAKYWHQIDPAPKRERFLSNYFYGKDRDKGEGYNQTREEFTKSVKAELAASGIYDEIADPLDGDITNKHNAVIANYVKNGGALSQKVYDSLDEHQKLYVDNKFNQADVVNSMVKDGSAKENGANGVSIERPVEKTPEENNSTELTMAELDEKISQNKKYAVGELYQGDSSPQSNQQPAAQTSSESEGVSRGTNQFNVGDTVYIEWTATGKLEPVNYRGRDGNNAVVVKDGKQMSVPYSDLVARNEPEKHYSEIILDTLVEKYGWKRSGAKGVVEKDVGGNTTEGTLNTQGTRIITASFDTDRSRYLTAYSGFDEIVQVDGRGDIAERAKEFNYKVNTWARKNKASNTVKVESVEKPTENKQVDDNVSKNDAGIDTLAQPTEQQLIDYRFLREFNGRWKYKTSNDSRGEFTADSKESAIEMATKAFNATPKSELKTQQDLYNDDVAKEAAATERRYGAKSIDELEKLKAKLVKTKDGLYKTGEREFNGNGGRRTAAAVSNEAARGAAQEIRELEDHIARRKAQEGESEALATPENKSRYARSSEAKAFDEQFEKEKKEKLAVIGELLAEANVFAPKAVKREALNPAKLSNAIADLMQLYIQKGIVEFKELSREIMSDIYERFGEAGADAITIDHLQGAYISFGQQEGMTPKRDVIAMDSIDELYQDDANETEQVNENSAEKTGASFPANETTGNTVTIATPSNEKEFEATYEVAEIGDITASHDMNNRINDKFNDDKLQGRDRTHVDYEVKTLNQIKNFNPKFLGSSVASDDGAPIITNESSKVISGNGRHILLSRLYSRYPEKAAQYKQWLIDNAQSFGLDADVIAKMDKPILVRRKSNDDDLELIADKSNVSGMAEMSALDRAFSDARQVNESVFLKFKGGEIESFANQDFVQAFNEALNLGGSLTATSLARMKNAIMAHAYGDYGSAKGRSIVEGLSEEIRPDAKSILNALFDSSSEWVLLRAAFIATGTKDFTNHLVDAVHLIRDARANGKEVKDMVDQYDMETMSSTDPFTRQFVQLFFKDANMKTMIAQKDIAAILKDVATSMTKQISNRDMFDDTKPLTPKQILENAYAKYKESKGKPAGQIGLIDAGFSPFATRGDKRREAESGKTESGQGVDSASVTDEGREVTDNEIVKKYGNEYRNGLLKQIESLNKEKISAKSTREIDRIGRLVDKAQKKLDDYDTKGIVHADFIARKKIEKGNKNVPSTNTDLERDSTVTNSANSRNETPVFDGSTGDADLLGQSSEPVKSTENVANSDSGDSISIALTGGEQGDNQLLDGNETDVAAVGTTRTARRERSSDDSSERIHDGRIGSNPIKELPIKGIKGLKPKQVTHKDADLENIKEAMPFLNEGQADDVVFAEKRFEEHNGVMFTNGTGTGKTFTGLGIVSRFANQGKTNTLIVAPSQNILNDWLKTAKNFFGLDITLLADTKDAGAGIVATTYANFGDNVNLVNRDWDLIVTDEAHYLMSNAAGSNTAALDRLRGLTGHEDGFYHWFNAKHNELVAEHKKVNDKSYFSAISDNVYYQERGEKEEHQSKINNQYSETLEAAREAWKAKESKTKVTMLSATPFAYESNIDYANGYLFEYGGDKSRTGAYNAGSGKDQFFMQHLGYRMRYNKLTKPDAKVDRSTMQRQFNENLKKTGAVSARTLDVPFDYDRQFILTESAIGQEIDRALQWLSDNKATELSEKINESFDHLARRYLLEAIKAKEIIPVIKEHLAAGRKVLVFHDYKKGGATNPFNIKSSDEKTNKQYQEFKRAFPDLTNSNALSDLLSPIERFEQEFGKDALIYNGDVSSKERIARVAQFNDDNSGKNLILLQSASAKEGVSFHDTTGVHQRVLINIGLPTAPTTAIQQEGRIYRVGQQSDAIFRYVNTGTNWERWAFASTIAGRASEAENLALGEGARGLRDAFINAFENSDSYPAGHEGEGKGGKDSDKQSYRQVTEMDRAKGFYYATQKKNSRTKSAEGTDYYATPEPVGLVMTRLADARAGEKMLEPSAGHGAIARWFRTDAERTAIEPSSELNSRLALVFQDGDIKRQTFEDLNIINKFDAIVMNPPFGTGGKTAIEHLEKAFNHLRDGGRVVALIPEGAMADKRLDAWLNGNSNSDIKPIATTRLGVDIYVGDKVTYFEWVGKGKNQKYVEKTIDVESATTGRDGSLFRVNGIGDKGSYVIIEPDTIKKIKPTGERPNTSNKQLVYDISLPTVTFERAGTKVKTHIVVIEKTTSNITTENIDLSGITDINQLFDRLDALSIDERVKPVEEVAETPAAKAETNSPAVESFAPDEKENFDHYAKISADSLASLRKTDLDRVLEQAQDSERSKFARYIASVRPDLFEEIHDIMKEDYGKENWHIALATKTVGTLVEGKHTKTGEAIFTVKTPYNKEAYSDWSNAAKRFGGFYSRYTKGFLFKTKDAANQFMDYLSGDNSEIKFSRTTSKLTLQDVKSEIKDMGINLFISEKDGVIELTKIVVPEELRDNKLGSKAMSIITDYADATGQTISLTPSSDFGGNKNRLIEFYKRFGFIDNKGRNKDFRFTDTMYREPKGNVKYSYAGTKAQNADQSALPADYFKIINKSTIPQSTVNSVSAYSKFFSDLLVSKTFSSQGLDGFDIPTQRLVMSTVISMIHNSKVRDVVIDLVPVDVVNNLTGEEFSSDVLLHDMPMLSNLLSIDTNKSISIPVDYANSLTREVALATTKLFNSSFSAGFGVETIPTVGTNEIGRFYSVSLAGIGTEKNASFTPLDVFGASIEGDATLTTFNDSHKDYSDNVFDADIVSQNIKNNTDDTASKTTHTTQSFITAAKSALDAKFGKGWFERLWGTGSFEAISNDEALRMVGELKGNPLFSKWFDDTLESEKANNDYYRRNGNSSKTGTSWFKNVLDGKVIKLRESTKNDIAKFLLEATKDSDSFLFGKSHSKDLYKVKTEVNNTDWSIGQEITNDGKDITLTIQGVEGEFVIGNYRSERPYIDAIIAPSMKGKDFGSLLYQIAYTWAHNNGKVITNPDGLTSINILRRTYQTLSSALRYGSTSHVQPSMDQIDSGMDWELGNDGANIEHLASLIEKRVFESAHKLNNLNYNLSDGNFYNQDGEIVNDDEIERLARSSTTARENGVGLATAKAALVTRALREAQAQDGRMVENSVANDAKRWVLNQKESKPVFKSSASGRIEAFYNPADDKVYFVPENISKDTDLAYLFAHEIGVHMMQMGENQAGFDAILKEVETLVKTKDPHAVKGRADAVKAGTKDAHLSEETLAYMIKHAPQLSVVKKFVAWFRKGLRNWGLTHFKGEAKSRWLSWETKLTSDDVSYMAYAALKRAPSEVVFKGDPNGGGTKFSSDKEPLLAPNGKPSNLNAMQHAQVRTPEFKAWFGDWENDPENASKVVDENGEPLVVYHGTGNYFNEFKPTKSTREFGGIETDVVTNAYFFTPSKDFADYVSKVRANRTMEVKEVYLNIPYLLEIDGYSDIEQFTDDTDQDFENKESQIWKYFDDSDFVTSFNDEFDGALFDDNDGKSYVVFNSNQIKSATGNTGAFSKDNNDIRFSKSLTPSNGGNGNNTISTDVDYDAYENRFKAAKPVKKAEEPREIQHDFIMKFLNKFEPVRSVTDRLNRFVAYFDPMGTLPNSDDYLGDRGLTLGKYDVADDLTSRIFSVLSKASEDDAVATYEYLTQKDASPFNIKDTTQREAATNLKETIIYLGEKLAEKGVIPRASYEENKGAYLPRVYLKHILGEEGDAIMSALGTGRTLSDQGYAKKRLNDFQLPPEVRRLILGEIKNAAYLASRTVNITMRDVAMMNFFESIATNKDWVWDQSLVTLELDLNTDEPTAIADAEGNIEYQKPDSKGKKVKTRKVTPFFLKKEAERMRRQAQVSQPKDRDDVNALAEMFEKIAENHFEQMNMKGLPKDFIKMPDSARYGALRGLVVRKEIYNDIVGTVNSFGSGSEISTAEKWLGEGGYLQMFNAHIKFARAGVNIPTQIINIISNPILIHIRGVRFDRVPKRLFQAIKEIRDEGEVYQIAKEYGLRKGTFYNQEMRHITNWLIELEAEKGTSWTTVGEAATYLMRKVGVGYANLNETVGNLHQFVEMVGKLASMIDDIENGITPRNAYLKAQDAVFDYSNVSPSVRWLRRNAIGIPFLTFFVKSTEATAKAIINRPSTVLTYYVALQALALVVAAMNDVDDDDLDALELLLKDYVREKGHAYFLPWRDEKGRWQAMDFGKILPWTPAYEIAHALKNLGFRKGTWDAEFNPGALLEAIEKTGLGGAPVFEIVEAFHKTTRKKDDGSTGGEKLAKFFTWAWNLSMPPMLAMKDSSAVGVAFDKIMSKDHEGALDKHGDPKFTDAQAINKWLGLNFYSVDPEAQIPEEQIKLLHKEQKIERDRQTDLKEPDLSYDDKKSINEDYDERARRAKAIKDEFENKMSVLSYSDKQRRK